MTENETKELLVEHAIGASAAAIVPDPLAAPRYKTGDYRRLGAYAPADRRKTPAVQNADTPPAGLEGGYPSGGLILNVTVLPWPQRYNYYQRFCLDAERFFALRGNPCPSVPYFSYTPQYAQLTHEQLSFYLYFREAARAGTPLSSVPFSYVLLYIYEIINLPRRIAPEDGAAALAALWLFYREEHPILDKYMTEWMCDYCLSRGVALPSTLLPLLPVILKRASLKEFYLSALLSECDGEIPVEALLLSASDYNYRLSKYYGENRDLFDARIPAAVGQALSLLGLAPDPAAMGRVKVERDAFCGSLCAQTVKSRILVEYAAFGRSYAFRRVVTAAAKLAENALRRELKIRPRLKVPEADEALLAAMAAIFPRRGRAAEVDLSYERLYDAPAEGLDYALARRLEGEQSFVVEDEPPVAAPPSFPGEAGGAVPYREALSALLSGEDLVSYARRAGLLPAIVAGALNDYAADALGDAILVPQGDGFALIDDYKEEIRTWLT